MREEELIRRVVQEVMFALDDAGKDNVRHDQPGRPVLCNYSNRHCHVSREDLDALFGQGFELTRMKDLVQPGEFASGEVITIVGPEGHTLPVRILGPVRKDTQVEISRSDAFALKIKNVPVRESGDVKGAPGAVLTGPGGAVVLKEGVIIAWRHIHFTPGDAEHYGVKDREMLRVKVDSPDRALIFDKVIARVKSTYRLEMHVDVDEANAAGIGQMTPVKILKN